MRLRSQSRRGSARGEGAFTFTEMMIAVTIFMFVVGGVIASNLFGLRMIELTEPKQQAAQRAREIRTSAPRRLTSSPSEGTIRRPSRPLI